MSNNISSCSHGLPVIFPCPKCAIHRSNLAGPLGTEKQTSFRIVYIAHPLRGATPEDTAINRRRASYLVARLSVEFPIAPIASWIILSEHWTEIEGRELGLKIDKALIEICNELWLIGPAKPLSEGMQIEHDHAIKHGLRIVDLRGIYV